MTELLPCPFCGSLADDFNPDGDMEGYSIHCSGKHAIFGADASCCPLGSFSFRRYEDAVAAWNGRTPDAQVAADAARYRKLKPMFTSANFDPASLDLGDTGVVLMFVAPDDLVVSSNLDKCLEGVELPAAIASHTKDGVRAIEQKGEVEE